MAESSTVALKEGDVVVLATDGLWDNLDDQMIWHEIKAHMKVSPTRRPTQKRPPIIRRYLLGPYLLGLTSSRDPVVMFLLV